MSSEDIISLIECSGVKDIIPKKSKGHEFLDQAGRGRPVKGTPKLTDEERKEAKRLTNERYYEKNRDKINQYMQNKYNKDLETSRLIARQKSEKYYDSHKEDMKLTQSIYYYKRVYESKIC
jgi:hypothetical protein